MKLSEGGVRHRQDSVENNLERKDVLDGGKLKAWPKDLRPL